MINDLPTVFEVVTGAAKQARDAAHNNSSKSKSSGKVVNLHDLDINAFWSSFLSCCLIVFCYQRCSAASSVGASAQGS